MPGSKKGSRNSGKKKSSSKGGRGNYRNKIIPSSGHSTADRPTRDSGLRGGTGGSSGDLGGGQGSGGMGGHGSGGGKGGGSPVTGP